MSSRLTAGVLRLTDPLRAKYNSDPPWTGAVERRAPASYQRQSEILIMRCPNESCRHWLRKPTPETPTRCKVCQVTAVYLDVLAAHALAEHRAGRSKPITDADF